MRVRSIEMRNVTKHVSTRVKLPDTGLVLVVGDNGSGKSSLIEAVAFGVWGKSLRGSKPWTHNKRGGMVRLDIDHPDGGMVQLHRSQSGRVKLAFSDHEPFESTKHAQAHANEVFGSFEDWRRTAVLSSQDAANFTSATDAERKRLLEQITGADALEPAYRLALEDRTALAGEVATVERELAVLRERVAGAERLVASLTEAAAPVAGAQPDVAEIDAALKRVLDAARSSEADLDDVRAARSQAIADQQTADAALKRIDADRAGVARDVCPTCGQAIDEGHRARVTGRLLEEARGPQSTRAAAQERAQALLGEEAELRAEVRALGDRRRALEADLAAARVQARAGAEAAAAADRIAGARSNLAAAVEAQEHVASRLADLKHRLAHVEAAARALSTRGVRAHLLGKTIAAVEAAANAWIGRIADGRFRLKLEPYGQKADGGVKDQVSLKIEVNRTGAAELMLEGKDAMSVPQTYQEASGGERRRVDVALMFAIAEVAEAARGQRGSTIFADEIFDALDDDGVDRVSDAVAELAESRCVVVIAHAAKGSLRAKADVVLRVVGGSVDIV